tara:strand:+ start:579 stop:923 length:345 start_codon:yes stop_codon:yes gene_type:complete
LLPDEKLPRFHAGHDIVKFFYGAVRQLPAYLVDGLLDMNVSVTLVGGPQLLVFHHPRARPATARATTSKSAATGASLPSANTTAATAFAAPATRWALATVPSEVLQLCGTILVP